MFPMLGWGIGLVFHAWDVFVGSAPSEEAIRHEMDRFGPAMSLRKSAEDR